MREQFTTYTHDAIPKESSHISPSEHVPPKPLNTLQGDEETDISRKIVFVSSELLNCG